ncbi:hypothetical protein GGR52DRAFT_592969 [Hypoxylon sp. FL1284]|nr:hypothetical protein GGR52DRAFT_592969 [Hypoxylon sp. FL1284]
MTLPREEARSGPPPAYSEASGPSFQDGPVELPAEREPVELPAEVPIELPAEVIVPAGHSQTQIAAAPKASPPLNFPSEADEPPSAPSRAAPGPTPSSPFDFPTDDDLPAYTASPAAGGPERRPLAIPQVRPDGAAPFLEAYSRSLLLRHGVTREAWAAFLRTLSGFLAATVSRNAVRHAADVAQSVGDVPRQFGRDTWQGAKRTGRNIGDAARRGHIVGAAAHAVVGGVALTVGTTLRAVGATVSLPFAAAGREPRTPRERAAAYAESANRKWLRRRGLEAHLLDTTELARGVGARNADDLLRGPRAVIADPADRAVAQMASLRDRVCELEIDAPAPLDLDVDTLWLVVTRLGEDEDAHSFYASDEKGRDRRREERRDKRMRERYRRRGAY